MADVADDLENEPGTHRKDFMLAKRAVNHAWPVGPQERQEVVDAAMRVLRNSGSEVRVLAAAKVLVQADLVNVRREANQIAERSQDVAAATAALRAALASPAARDALANLSDQLCQEQPGGQAHQDSPVTLPAPPGPHVVEEEREEGHTPT